MKFAKRLTFALLGALLSINLAAQTLPPNTVMGRLGTLAGPPEAIPLATLGAQIPLTAVGAALIGYTPPGSGAVATTAAAEFQLQCLNVDDYGAVGDGTTDDTTPLTNFLTAVLASNNRCGRFSAKTYAITAALPTINKSGVALYGYGPTSYHAVGSTPGTVIKWTGSAGSTMLTASAVSGGSNQRLDGVKLIGLTFNCANVAANGVALASIFNGDFDFSALECTGIGLSTSVVSSLGDAADFQFNRIRYTCTNFIATAGVCLQVTGSSTANTSFNWFEMVDIGHSNALGIDVINADNNLWGNVRVFQAGGGTAPNSIQWRGGASSAVSARNETFLNLSTTVAAIAKGTGTYTVGAQSIRIMTLDLGNSTPAPTEEAGTTIYDNQWRMTAPTLTAGTGSITTSSVSLRYMREWRKMNLGIAISITTNGSGNSNLQLTVPTAAANNVGSGAILIGRVNGTAKVVNGLVAQNSATLVLDLYDGSYPGADGASIFVTGAYETN